MTCSRTRLLTSLLCAALLGFPASAGGAGAPAPRASAPAAIQTTMTKTFKNPVLDINFPDPFILRVGDTYHAYATNGAGGNVPHAVSSDLVHWQMAGDVLPLLPSWAEPGLTWAPEVSHLGGRYQLYFTAHDKNTQRQCVGVAVADSPAGPFMSDATAPLVCQADEGGSIDASPFVDDDGKVYLLWKNDGNCCNLATHLYIQPLSADGLTLGGKPTSLLVNDQLWEGRVIEAPTLHKQGGVYYLLYSAGPFDSDLYSVGYATSKSVTGPYQKAEENPVLFSDGEVAGPGHQSVFSDAAGQTWMVYHAWTAGQIGDDVGYRSMRLDKVNFSGGKVTVNGPTTTTQPAPKAQP
ncbi:glycoside hydrolase [Deinococcus irradiatisoli]|uniref:Glycoside hydrolase n=1 Tax=Deinococcus irradiatisoli TaxID=2202254 RepID=A0A2Z3JVI7_9DEIO|nr:glycoside hydrolase family 43 protein [Deinococcus irradiatisoli]AWN24484.1 glycoside hydrolase [Deinococcus irradiatisoli]